jgi:hypothetical protein
MNQIFDLNYQWATYCQMVQCPEEKMHPVQRTETKRAFMGAAGQILLLLKDNITAYDETEGIHILKNMIDQVASFWKDEMLSSQQAKN